MRPGPAGAVALLPTVLRIDSAPMPAAEWLAQIILAVGWAPTEARAAEMAETWEERFLHRLADEMSRLHDRGRVCEYAFNSSSEYMVQGSAFVEPGIDSPSLAEAKQRRQRLREHAESIRGVTARQFEALCVGLLNLFGSAAPVLTPRGSDEGIDFYGKINVGPLLGPIALPGVHSMLNAWMVGQAKHYPNGQAATPEIRELVGSVNLAQAKAYSRDSVHPQLDIRVCDPVFYLFFTTGTISARGWQLLDSAGVIGMDGDMVAAFLADNEIGVDAGVFDANAFAVWIDQFS